MRLIVRRPVVSGLLAGTFTRPSVFGAQDHRHYNRDGQAFNVGETFVGMGAPIRQLCPAATKE